MTVLGIPISGMDDKYFAIIRFKNHYKELKILIREASKLQMHTYSCYQYPTVLCSARYLLMFRIRKFLGLPDALVWIR
jgi:hypothetical protein